METTTNVVGSPKAWGRSSNTVHAANAEGNPLCGATIKYARETTCRVSCSRCAKKIGTEVPHADTLLRPGSLLSAKKQRELSLPAQVQSLVRIAKRAQAHAEWMRECAASPDNPSREADLADAIKSEARAKAATLEMSRIVIESDYPHWSPAQRATARRFVEAS